MQTVNIAELKASLSSWLQIAKSGEEVIIKDRNTPVARLLPCVTKDMTEHERELVARGELKLPVSQPGTTPFPYPVGPVVEHALLMSILDEDREGR